MATTITPPRRSSLQEAIISSPSPRAKRNSSNSSSLRAALLSTPSKSESSLAAALRASTSPEGQPKKTVRFMSPIVANYTINNNNNVNKKNQGQSAKENIINNSSTSDPPVVRRNSMPQLFKQQLPSPNTKAASNNKDKVLITNPDVPGLLDSPDMNMVGRFRKGSIEKDKLPAQEAFINKLEAVNAMTKASQKSGRRLSQFELYEQQLEEQNRNKYMYQARRHDHSSSLPDLTKATKTTSFTPSSNTSTTSSTKNFHNNLNVNEKNTTEGIISTDTATKRAQQKVIHQRQRQEELNGQIRKDNQHFAKTFQAMEDRAQQINAEASKQTQKVHARRSSMELIQEKLRAEREKEKVAHEAKKQEQHWKWEQYQTRKNDRAASSSSSSAPAPPAAASSAPAPAPPTNKSNAVKSNNAAPAPAPAPAVKSGGAGDRQSSSSSPPPDAVISSSPPPSKQITPVKSNLTPGRKTKTPTATFKVDASAGPTLPMIPPSASHARSPVPAPARATLTTPRRQVSVESEYEEYTILDDETFQTFESFYDEETVCTLEDDQPAVRDAPIVPEPPIPAGTYYNKEYNNPTTEIKANANANTSAAAAATTTTTTTTTRRPSAVSYFRGGGPGGKVELEGTELLMKNESQKKLKQPQQESNPEVPGLFDTPSGGRLFRYGMVTTTEETKETVKERRASLAMLSEEKKEEILELISNKSSTPPQSPPSSQQQDEDDDLHRQKESLTGPGGAVPAKRNSFTEKFRSFPPQNTVPSPPRASSISTSTTQQTQASTIAADEASEYDEFTIDDTDTLYDEETICSVLTKESQQLSRSGSWKKKQQQEVEAMKADKQDTVSSLRKRMEQKNAATTLINKKRLSEVPESSIPAKLISKQASEVSLLEENESAHGSKNALQQDDGPKKQEPSAVESMNDSAPARKATVTELNHDDVARAISKPSDAAGAVPPPPPPPRTGGNEQPEDQTKGKVEAEKQNTVSSLLRGMEDRITTLSKRRMSLGAADEEPTITPKTKTNLGGVSKSSSLGDLKKEAVSSSKPHQKPSTKANANIAPSTTKEKAVAKNTKQGSVLTLKNEIDCDELAESLGHASNRQRGAIVDCDELAELLAVQAKTEAKSLAESDDLQGPLDSLNALRSRQQEKKEPPFKENLTAAMQQKKVEEPKTLERRRRSAPQLGGMQSTAEVPPMFAATMNYHFKHPKKEGPATRRSSKKETSTAAVPAKEFQDSNNSKSLQRKSMPASYTVPKKALVPITVCVEEAPPKPDNSKQEKPPVETVQKSTEERKEEDMPQNAPPTPSQESQQVQSAQQPPPVVSDQQKNNDKASTDTPKKLHKKQFRRRTMPAESVPAMFANSMSFQFSPTKKEGTSLSRAKAKKEEAVAPPSPPPPQNVQERNSQSPPRKTMATSYTVVKKPLVPITVCVESPRPNRRRKTMPAGSVPAMFSTSMNFEFSHVEEEGPASSGHSKKEVAVTAAPPAKRNVQETSNKNPPPKKKEAVTAAPQAKKNVQGTNGKNPPRKTTASSYTVPKKTSAPITVCVESPRPNRRRKTMPTGSVPAMFATSMNFQFSPAKEQGLASSRLSKKQEPVAAAPPAKKNVQETGNKNPQPKKEVAVTAAPAAKKNVQGANVKNPPRKTTASSHTVPKKTSAPITVCVESPRPNRRRKTMPTGSVPAMFATSMNFQFSPAKEQGLASSGLSKKQEPVTAGPVKSPPESLNVQEAPLSEVEPGRSSLPAVTGTPDHADTQSVPPLPLVSERKEEKPSCDEPPKQRLSPKTQTTQKPSLVSKSHHEKLVTQKGMVETRANARRHSVPASTGAPKKFQLPKVKSSQLPPLFSDFMNFNFDDTPKGGDGKGSTKKKLSGGRRQSEPVLNAAKTEPQKMHSTTPRPVSRPSSLRAVLEEEANKVGGLDALAQENRSVNVKTVGSATSLDGFGKTRGRQSRRQTMPAFSNNTQEESMLRQRSAPQVLLPVVNPEVPGLLDTPKGNVRFRPRKERPSVVMAEDFQKTVQEAINMARRPSLPADVPPPRKVPQIKLKSTKPPPLFCDTMDFFEQATTVGVVLSE